jgi:hypothetical protein
MPPRLPCNIPWKWPHQDKLDTEGSVIRKRLANFKAHQERFQREREDYFQKTMAKARTHQWTPPIDNK